jgi:hypothetical protein
MSNRYMKTHFKAPGLILLLSFAVFTSCSKSPDSDATRTKLEEENAKLKRELTAATSTTAPEARPSDEQIRKDCQGLVEATTADDKANILRMDSNGVDGVSASGQICEVLVRLSVSFMPCDASRGYMIWGGGVAGWVSSSDVATLRGGETPSGQRVYKVRLSYRRYDTGWRPEQAR